MRKKAMTHISLGMAVSVIFAILILTLLIVGIINGWYKPAFETVGAKFDQMLIFFHLKAGINYGAYEECYNVSIKELDKGTEFLNEVQWGQDAYIVYCPNRCEMYNDDKGFYYAKNLDFLKLNHNFLDLPTDWINYESDKWMRIDNGQYIIYDVSDKESKFFKIDTNGDLVMQDSNGRWVMAQASDYDSSSFLYNEFFTYEIASWLELGSGYKMDDVIQERIYFELYNKGISLIQGFKFANGIQSFNSNSLFSSLYSFKNFDYVEDYNYDGIEEYLGDIENVKKFVLIGDDSRWLSGKTYHFAEWNEVMWDIYTIDDGIRKDEKTFTDDLAALKEFQNRATDNLNDDVYFKITSAYVPEIALASEDYLGEGINILIGGSESDLGLDSSDKFNKLYSEFLKKKSEILQKNYPDKNKVKELMDYLLMQGDISILDNKYLFSISIEESQGEFPILVFSNPTLGKYGLRVSPYVEKFSDINYLDQAQYLTIKQAGQTGAYEVKKVPLKESPLQLIQFSNGVWKSIGDEKKYKLGKRFSQIYYLNEIYNFIKGKCK